MTQSPDYSTLARPSAGGPLSKASLTSLVLGILGCIPLSGLAAIFFAVAGFRATRGAARRGRGLAIAGLVLGIVGTVAWSCLGGFVALIVAGSSTPRAMVHQFASDVANGNIAAASAQCDTSITPADLSDLHDKLAPFGAYSDLTCYSANLNSGSLGTTCTLSGVVHFSGGSHTFNAIVRKDASGNWKVFGFHVY